MPGAPQVTVLVPVFNAEQWIESTLRSVLDQTWTDLECIVIDDGSTDDTPGVLHGFGDAITVVRQENQGVSTARNLGVARARGKLVAFLDADDLWLPNKLERQVAVMSSRPDAGLIYTGFSVVDDNLKRRYDILPSPWTKRVRGVVTLSGYGIGFGATAMVPRHVLDEVGPFDERLSTAADADYVWRLAQRFVGVGIRAPLVLYRQHVEQMHGDLEVFEHDAALLMDSARGTGLADGEWRRARANLDTHLCFHELAAGQYGNGVWHARGALRRAPTRVLALPADAIRRRVVRSITGAWPLLRRPDPSIVD